MDRTKQKKIETAGAMWVGKQCCLRGVPPAIESDRGAGLGGTDQVCRAQHVLFWPSSCLCLHAAHAESLIRICLMFPGFFLFIILFISAAAERERALLAENQALRAAVAAAAADKESRELRAEKDAADSRSEYLSPVP